MPIAAVPAYLGQVFESAPPGMRFGMYLNLWTSRTDQENEVRKRARQKSHEGQEIRRHLETHGMDHTIAWLCSRERNPLPRLWRKNDFAARQVWQDVCALSKSDRHTLTGLIQRQAALAAALPDCFILPAKSTAPFTTGLGNEHPLENGFSFLWPYGLPYLPGSGVKGVLRQAARELASGAWGDDTPWCRLPPPSGRGEHSTALDILFGLESADRQSEHFRGVLNFWDVIPDIRGDRLMVEIMTPHQTHYYRDGRQPHDSGQPTPIPFLTVPPGSGFTFHVQCDRARLAHLAPELARDDRWRTLLRSAFEHAFDWLGFGAKTTVGYGAMQVDSRAATKKRRQAQPDEKTPREATSTLPADAAEIEKARPS